MMQQATVQQPVRRWSMADTGMALSVALAVIYGVLVEEFGLVMLRNHADGHALAVLGLFAAPLLTSWVAIAIWMVSRPTWVRWSVAALLLLAPPLILVGLLNA